MKFEEFYGRFCEHVNIFGSERSPEHKERIKAMYDEIDGLLIKDYIEVRNVAKTYQFGKREAESKSFGDEHY
mgnify:FL=1